MRLRISFKNISLRRDWHKPTLWTQEKNEKNNGFCKIKESVLSRINEQNHRGKLNHAQPDEICLLVQSKT